ncbi:DNA polymerase III subunit alpha [Lactococcus termiticola]|uniref:DNA polymerase III subunit alpha n=1 Tax=Lactococcus termiticola TaxID=2169526 RepID=A0A2R5HDC0_9LACT|nr:DNA polymerase III subunit alpha [Lactococcus termiticola]GBG96074.1 DNA polymerase III subunit alpha [Lactococcus termiticola]
MFAQLNTKTEYSFLDSVVRTRTYFERAQHLGFETIGITDVGNLYAARQLMTRAKDYGLKAVVGLELSFSWQGLPITFAFIAKNTTGYKHLLRILTLHNYERRSFEDIKNYLEGLALVVPEAYGNLPELAKLVPELYVGINRSTSKEARFLLPALPFPSVRYLDPEDAESLEVLHAIRDGLVYDPDRMLGQSELLQRPESYQDYFQKHFPEAVKNLEILVADISYETDEKLALPRFDKTRPAVEHLRAEAEAGLALRQLSSDTVAYQDRLDRELSVIHQMGFDDYFLIVADLLRYAKEEGIYCGMGRGSAAGSLVAYALGITQVDPVKNHLLFERFLNPERIAMPDIDIDMPDDKRADFLAYMKNRYGNDHVAQIVTFSTLAKRQAIRDVAKAFGLSEIEISGMTRLLANRFGSLADEYESNPRFKAELLKNPQLMKIYELARRIEGMPRQTSVHASGVVLSERSLVNYVALKPSDDLALAQYEAGDIEAIGLLKIDFLGLRNLSVLERMRSLVKTRKQLDVDPVKIDLEDEETLALFRAGNTLGIFQFENPQMRRFLRNLSPTKFDDIVDATSIFRPGPSQFIPQFVARRHGKEAVPEVDASIQDILAPTYGIMIYQEQIMQVAQRFSGFSLGRADLLRRAISKKKDGEFERLRSEFLAGAKSLGHSEGQASQIYDLIERFANYGFNRSHAYAYAALAFQLAYFKAHFPDEFYEVQLGDRKRETMLADALDNGLVLDKPAVNKMPYHDRVGEHRISIGLRQLHSLPRDLAFWLVENRPFESLSSLVRSLPENWQKKDYLMPLIQVGAFDDLEDSNRGMLAANIERLIDYHQTFQLDLFKESNSQLKFSYQTADDFSPSEKYQFEKDLLGVGITPHPLQSLAGKFLAQFTPLEQLEKNKRQTVLVELLNIRTHRTKTGETMAFLTTSDSKNNFSVTLFPENYRHFMGRLEQGHYYLMTGKVTERNDELQLAADRISELVETDRKLWLNLQDNSKNKAIAKLLAEFPGSHQVVLHSEVDKATRQINQYVAEDEQLLKRLSSLVLAAVYK